MSNLIPSILFFLTCCTIYILKKKRDLFNLTNQLRFGNGVLNYEIQKNEGNLQMNSKPKPGLNRFKDFSIKSNGYPASKYKAKAELFDSKITVAKKDLESNLKHLELILALESPLSNLASKDNCSIERLQEFVKIKKDVQLKVIELSQSINYYQSQKINLC